MSIYNDNSVKLNPRFTVHTRAQVKVAKQWDVVPELMWQMQDSKYEVSYGAHAKYYLAMKSAHTVAINMGAYGRSAESGWLFAGMDYDNLQVNLSYDLNFSKLHLPHQFWNNIPLLCHLNLRTCMNRKSRIQFYRIIIINGQKRSAPTLLLALVQRT